MQLQAYNLKEICKQHVKIADKIIASLNEKGKKVIPEFQRYLQVGYYPYFYEVNDDAIYKMTLEQNIRTTIEADLASVYPHLTGSSIHKIKQLLSFIANAVPFMPNWSHIKEILEIGDLRTLKNYFCHLEDAGVIQSIPKATQKLSKLESPSKIYLENTNQLYAIASKVPEKGTVRETFFLTMTSQQYQVKMPMNGDFSINDCLFEVGGKNKSFQQIKAEKNAYLVCDEIERVHLFIRTIENKTEEIILNMNPVRSHILAILGPQFEKIYANG